MILDAILGKNIDILMWVKYLREGRVGYMIVIDYECKEETEEIDNIIYMSPNFAKEYIKNSIQLYFINLCIATQVWEDVYLDCITRARKKR